jgi:EF hand
MKTHIAASLLALTMAATGQAWAQSPASPTPASPPAASAGEAVMAPAAEAKFKAADPGGTGFIQGAALDSFKPVMAKVDTNKDGKISRAEFAAAVKAGVIK